MKKKSEIIKIIEDTGVVAVIRAEDASKAVNLIDACVSGGIKAVEITFTVPGAQRIIEEIAFKYKDTDILVGAGTVLDPETARAAILAGACFIVSPCLSKETLKLCNRYNIPCMPGAMTIKEVVEAMESGADIIKIFPGELFGPPIIKAIKGPLPHARLMPTGGVTADNAAEWIKAGSIAVGAGGSLTSPGKKGDYEAVKTAAKEFIKNVKAARSVDNNG